jgi:hypothetical protein
MHNLLLDCGVDSVNSTPLSRILTLLPLQGLPLFVFRMRKGFLIYEEMREYFSPI